MGDVDDIRARFRPREPSAEPYPTVIPFDRANPDHVKVADSPMWDEPEVLYHVGDVIGDQTGPTLPTSVAFTAHTGRGRKKAPATHPPVVGKLFLDSVRAPSIPPRVGGHGGTRSGRDEITITSVWVLPDKVPNRFLMGVTKLLPEGSYVVIRYAVVSRVCEDDAGRYYQLKSVRMELAKGRDLP